MSLAQILLASQLPTQLCSMGLHDMQEVGKGIASWKTVTKHLILGTSLLVIARNITIS